MVVSINLLVDEQMRTSFATILCIFFESLNSPLHCPEGGGLIKAVLLVLKVIPDCSSLLLGCDLLFNTAGQCCYVSNIFYVKRYKIY